MDNHHHQHTYDLYTPPTRLFIAGQSRYAKQFRSARPAIRIRMPLPRYFCKCPAGFIKRDLEFVSANPKSHYTRTHPEFLSFLNEFCSIDPRYFPSTDLSGHGYRRHLTRGRPDGKCHPRRDARPPDVNARLGGRAIRPRAAQV